MVINCRVNPPEKPMQVFVDGKILPLCWYSDPEKGVAKTYDVFGDGIPYVYPYIPDGKLPHPYAVESGGAWSLTVRGRVEVVPLEQ